MDEPPPVDVSKVIVQPSKSFGRSAFAAVAIPAGELVLSEDPILFYNSKKGDSVVEGVLALFKKHQKANPNHTAAGIPAEDLAGSIGLYINYCRATDDIRKHVLEEVQGTAASGMEQTSPVVRTAAQASVLATLAPEITKLLQVEAATQDKKAADVHGASTDVAEIQHVLLAAEINVHSLGEAIALNAIGSKLPHTCGSPNTYYKSFGNRCCHVALRDIAAGELLTTSYMPTVMNITSTIARQRYLREVFSFQCGCDRCSKQLDKLCVLPCQRCATGDNKRDARGHINPRLLTDGTSAISKPATTGLLHWDPTKAAPYDPSTEHVHSAGCCGHDHHHDHDHCDHDHDHDHCGHNHHNHNHHDDNHSRQQETAAAEAAAAAEEASKYQPWSCSKCGVQLPDVDLELVGDFHYVKHAHDRIERWAYTTALHFNPQEDEERLHDLVAVMGPYHWSVHFALKLQTDLWKAMLRSICQAIQEQGNLPEDGMRALQNASSGIEQNQRRTWAWLTKWAGCSDQEASELMYETLALNACHLLEASALISARLHGGPLRSLAASMKQAGLDLLDKAELGLAALSRWQLPQPHPLIARIDQAKQQLLERKAAAAGAAAAAAVAPLSMNQLMDFLPTGSKAAGKASSSSKSKTKKGGKKK